LAAEVTGVAADPVDITVRYFAAIRAAADSDAEQLALHSGTSVEELVEILARRSLEMAHVLLRCSFLCDGMAVRDRSQLLQAGNIIDVLPPFAGG
jgi:molybdopterin converting factor small subunit